MFFILSKLLGYFIKPFNLIILFLLISFFIKNKEWKKRIRWFSLALFLVFSNGIIFNECMLLWEKPAISMSELNDDYDLAVVLGGTTNVDRELIRAEA